MSSQRNLRLRAQIWITEEPHQQNDQGDNDDQEQADENFQAVLVLKFAPLASMMWLGVHVGIVRLCAK